MPDIAPINQSDSSLPEDITNNSGVNANDDQSATNLIRNKVAQIYNNEPDASEEMTEASGVQARSKHQQFMYNLGTSGKDLATIQTEWHAYYSALPNEEKFQVWEEFYDSQSTLTKNTVPVLASANANPKVLVEHKQQAAKPKRHKSPKSDSRKPSEIQAVIRDKVSAGGKLKAKHHVQSLLFGLSMGFIVVFIFLFGFFNEVLIAPFIQPSRASATTPIIISSNGVAPTPNPEVIIPKINVEIPVNYAETSTDESVIENDLQDGVVHYPTTVFPGQNGNTAFFGHSSNNIFNQGKYKFAFVLLHTLVNGDTFYLTYNDKAYVYKVISHTIVAPNDVGVLGPVPGQTATATLITCDPPGTSINRLIVVGQQISPSPVTNTVAASTQANISSSPSQLPNDGPTLWSRFIKTIIGKLVVGVVIVLVILFILKRYYKKLQIA